MEYLAITAVVLLAMLTAVSVPVLLQLHRTLRSVREFVESTSPRIDRALEEFGVVSARLRGIADEMEASAPRVKRLLDSAEGVANGIDHVRKSLGVAAAVGPAAFAAVRYLFKSFAGSRARDDDELQSGEAADLASVASWGSRDARS